MPGVYSRRLGGSAGVSHSESAIVCNRKKSRFCGFFSSNQLLSYVSWARSFGWGQGLVVAEVNLVHIIVEHGSLDSTS